MNIGVVGAGVIGLTTALELQKEFRNAKITILADRFTTETTSDVAAGVFRPGTSFSGPNEEVTRFVYMSYTPLESIYNIIYKWEHPVDIV